jgi:diguanylate cyclase (GGDEF)-like protein
MKALYKLSTIYIIGFIFLSFTILVAILSFKDIYHSTGEIINLVQAFSSSEKGKDTTLSPKLIDSIHHIEVIRKRALGFFSFALLFSSTGALLIVYIYKRNIVEPLRRIVSAINKIEHGEFEELPVEKATEIGIISERLNAMGHALRDRMAALKEAVRSEQTTIRKLNILNELNSSLIFKLSVNDVIDAIVSFSEPLIKSGIKTIAVIDKTTQDITHIKSSPVKYAEGLSFLINNLILEFKRNETIPLRMDYASGGEKFDELTRGIKVEIKNILAVPIIIDGALRGIFIFANKTGEDAFNTEDEDSALMVAIQAGVAIEKALYHEETLHLAKTDGLTGLNNHRTFHEVLDFEIRRARRFNRYLSLLLIDVDFFKDFNDTYGHQAGDIALKDLANIIRRNLRSVDSAARYGGEEFAVILFETLSDGAFRTAERIRNEVKNHTFDMGEYKANLTVSIGISTFPDDALDKERLIKFADDALYMAKRKGRNSVITYQQYKKESVRGK